MIPFRDVFGLSGWESDTDEAIRQVEVEIHQETTRHIVNVPKLLNWLSKIRFVQDSKRGKRSCGNCLEHDNDQASCISTRFSGNRVNRDLTRNL